MTNIIEIGELRIKRERRNTFEGCQHKNFTVDPNGDTVICNDCQKQIGSHFALVLLIENWDKEVKKLEAKQARHAEELTKSVSLRAAQRVESVWRSRTMVPMCPHCSEAIFPEDNLGGSATNREMAIRRRQTSLLALKAEKAAGVPQ